MKIFALLVVCCGALGISAEPVAEQVLEEEADFEEGEVIKKHQTPIINPILPPGPININPDLLVRAPPATITTLRPCSQDLLRLQHQSRHNPTFGLHDLGLNVVDGSKADKLNSEWSVITPRGHIYRGSLTVLKQEFQKARADIFGDLLIRGDPSDDNGLSLSGFSKRSVFPPDTRLKVSQPHIYPWSSMGRVDSGSTGTFIGPQHVLTAGHSFRTKKWYRNLNFRRAKNCNPHKGTLYKWKYTPSP